MINAYFDIRAFINALDCVREERGLTWHSVYHETGVYGVASVGKREDWCTAQGARVMSVNTMATLAVWAQLDIREYVKLEHGGLSQLASPKEEITTHAR